ncbi:hypothetical protein G6F56_008600 [Rhizopus delemar]|uniref:Lysosomal dipeptide transporter MFSD1 n=1 Tax=Rhizopus stolonifer TaxID=4846 RepID=A0A367IV91_RHIST|nr:hypothetical protein G6F56_008600 [Rhizopus delemar]RCH81598.1 hypothetical protein CU098_002729 [Rhizopus stolonifer]
MSTNIEKGSKAETAENLSNSDLTHSLQSKKQEISETASWKMKAFVLLSILSLPVGCHFLEATLGTLKTPLKRSMKINNTQFSILLSCVTLVNTVLPLVAGFLLDDVRRLGPIRSTAMVSMIIVIGSILVAIGANLNSYSCMVTGQVIYGLGGGMIITMEEGIFSRWFRDKEVAIVVGISLSVARLTKWIAKMIAFPIVNLTGSIASPIYVGTFLCILGALINFIYWFVMWKKGMATISGKDLSLSKTKVEQKKENKWSYSVLLYIPGIFWMVPLVQLVMSSVLSSFDDVATEYIEFRYQKDSIMAGYQSSLTQVVPIVGAPLLGIFVHKYGQRLTLLFIGTLVLLVSMVLLSYTWVVPAVGMIIFSMALSLGPVALLSSTSLLLPHELSGTAMGLHKCANNIGTTIVSVLVGYVQDLTYHDGNPYDDMTDLQTEYDGVMILYLVLAVSSVFIAIAFLVLDRMVLHSWLQVNKTERDKRLDEYVNGYEKTEEDLKLVGLRLRKKKKFTYVSFFAFWLIVAWIIFFTFALMPVYQHYNIT